MATSLCIVTLSYQHALYQMILHHNSYLASERKSRRSFEGRFFSRSALCTCVTVSDTLNDRSKAQNSITDSRSAFWDNSLSDYFKPKHTSVAEQQSFMKSRIDRRRSDWLGYVQLILGYYGWTQSWYVKVPRESCTVTVTPRFLHPNLHILSFLDIMELSKRPFHQVEMFIHFDRVYVQVWLHVMSLSIILLPQTHYMNLWHPAICNCQSYDMAFDRNFNLHLPAGVYYDTDTNNPELANALRVLSVPPLTWRWSEGSSYFI